MNQENRNQRITINELGLMNQRGKKSERQGIRESESQSIRSQSSRIRELSNLGNVFSLRKAGPKGVPPCPLMEHSPLRTSAANFLPKPELVNRAGKGVSGLIRGIFKGSFFNSLLNFSLMNFL
uniref:Uncharacterized protein n=1 Tax=Romanomermis culicivorax TaxID=13658 RepID=A0A915K0V6_ROMCU